MKKNAKNSSNSVNAPERETRYVVLMKTGRIQVLVQPKAKQLRKRGRRGWRLYETVSSSNHAGRALIGTIQRALREMEGTSTAAVGQKRKIKSSKSNSKR